MSAALYALCFSPSPDASGDGGYNGRGRIRESAATPVSLEEDADAARIRAGDAAAFDRVVDTYFDTLVRFAVTFLHARDTAEDVVQTVFVRIWAGHETWRPTVGIRAYLFRAVRNQSFTELTRTRAESRTQSIVERAGDIPPTADDILERDERMIALRAALAGLAERRRTALRLRFEEELSYADVGTVLGVSEKAAQELVSRAVGTLRARLSHLR
jgi:RNA polymerase sigma-70 factor (ECF subfamily)